MPYRISICMSMIIVIMVEYEIRKINYYRLTGERYSCKCRTEAD